MATRLIRHSAADYNNDGWLDLYVFREGTNWLYRNLGNGTFTREDDSVAVIGTGAAVLFGFDSLADPVNNPNSSESLLWLACLYSVIPAMFKFVAMPLLWNYPLTEARLAEVQKEIQAESGSAPSPTKS